MRLHSKKDFQYLLKDILSPLSDKFSPECAYLEFGSNFAVYENISSKVEAFARPLWGLVPLWGGSDDDFFSEIYLKGIVSGANPKSNEYWGSLRDRDQRFVEMAPLAYALLFAPERVWYPLSDTEKNNLSKWLYSINQHTFVQNNWLFFRVLINIALKKHGYDYCEDILESDLALIESFYLGDGWYSDGKTGQKDYYIAFAIHFYSLIYAKAMEKEDPLRCGKFKSRAYEFAKEYIYWFADSGEAVPYGRSLTYRFAQISFWGALVLNDVYPFSIGEIKGIIARNLRYWFSDKRIFDTGNIMSIGYRYPNLMMSEYYNSYGSPYWSMKAFIMLLLPDTHPFWCANESEMPKLEEIKKLEKADMLAAHYDGRATLYPTGTLQDCAGGHMAEKYLKFAYSSKFGFCAAKSNLDFYECAPDSTLAFELDGRIFTRHKSNGFELYDDKLVIKWSPLYGINIETQIIPTKEGHIRKHSVNSAYDCVCYDSGFAVCCDDWVDFSILQGEGFAVAKNIYGQCTVKSESGECTVLSSAPNTNLLYSKTKIPTVKYNIKKGINTITTHIYED